MNLHRFISERAEFKYTSLVETAESKPTNILCVAQTHMRTVIRNMSLALLFALFRSTRLGFLRCLSIVPSPLSSVALYSYIMYLALLEILLVGTNTRRQQKRISFAPVTIVFASVLSLSKLQEPTNLREG